MTSDKLIRILQINTKDIGGGAEKIALYLHKAYSEQNYLAHLMVGVNKSKHPGIQTINNNFYRSNYAKLWLFAGESLTPLSRIIPGVFRLQSFMKWIGQPHRKIEILQGYEDFNFPGTKHIPDMLPFLPNILHAHNLHGEYFDIRELPRLSHRFPFVLTLHDEWLLTGHCAYTMGCPKWEYGCGECPDLTIYPAMKKDATDWNWQRKRSIYQRSRLFVVTPSRWLMERVKCSMLNPIETRVIQNGVDLDIFHPNDQSMVRNELGIPSDAFMLLAIAQQARENPFKDYETIDLALHRFRSNNRPIIFYSLGGKESEEKIGEILVRNIGFVQDERTVAKYLQATNVFLHATKADNFPTTIIEALACGKPVIATAIGGIPEQIEDGLNGFLIPPKGAQEMANRIQLLIDEPERKERMGYIAHQDALLKYDVHLMVERYLIWYAEILEQEEDQHDPYENNSRPLQ